jgi:hypothetical protein
MSLKFSSFKLVVPTQSGGVGLYMVWSMWFLSHLSLEGTGSYPDLLGRNRWHTVPRIHDPNNSPRTIRRAGGWGRSLDGRQIRYSYVTMSTIVGFDCDAMVLEPPWL